MEALDDAVGLRRMVEDGPTAAIHGVVRWRIFDLCQWLFEEFRISVSETYKSILDLTDSVSWLGFGNVACTSANGANPQRENALAAAAMGGPGELVRTMRS